MTLDGVEVVSWDVDGTLYAMPRLRLALAAELGRSARRGRFVRDVGEVRRLLAWKARMDALRRTGGQIVLDDDARAEREIVRALERRWYAAALARIGPRADAVALLDAISRRGVRQVVLSDYDSEDKLAALGLRARFGAIYSGERVGWLKPAPALFAAVRDALGVPAARWLHVGDQRDRDGGVTAVGGRVHIL